MLDFLKYKLCNLYEIE